MELRAHTSPFEAMTLPTTNPEQRKQRVDKLVDVLTKNPGLTLWEVAKTMGVSQSVAEVGLVWAEDQGILTYEDNNGCLFLLANEG